MSQTGDKADVRDNTLAANSPYADINAASRPEREHEATSLLRHVNRVLRTSVFSAWMEVDLSFAQLRTLLVLAEGGPYTVGHVAKELCIGVSTAGHLVERLVRLGMAQRQEDAADRRRVMVSLTEQGRDFRERLLGEVAGLDPALQALSDDELAAFVYGMRAVARELDQRGHPH